MRIVFVIPQLTNGGAEREVAAFANALVAKGEDVNLIFTHDEKCDYVVDEKVHRNMLRSSNVHVPKLRGLCNIFVSVVQLRKLSADVIIPFYLPWDFYVRVQLAALFSKTRLLYAVRNNQIKEPTGKKDRWRRRIACYMAEGIWVQTKEQRDFFSKTMQKKIFEVHNILDGRFLDIPRRNREKIRKFISVGRIHPQKNQRMLIEAFAGMVERTGNRDATLTIYGKTGVGDLETEMELRSLISRHHLEDRIFLPGRVTDIEIKYEDADAFVFSSDYEGCPNALMEAMAAGLPCISTDCPTGPSMLIESGKNGLLVPVRAVEEMSLAMEYLIENPDTANQMGKAAKRTMRGWGSPEELAEQLLTHLRKI